MANPVTLADDEDAPEGLSEKMKRILGAVDPARVALDCAINGAVTVENLWWLYEGHDISVDACGWLLAMGWAGELDPDEVRRLGRPEFLRWFEKRRPGD